VGQEELRSLKDVVSQMGTGGASRALKTLGERSSVWAKRYSWTKPRDYETSVPEFAASGGGGKAGVGVSKAAARAVFNELNKA